MSDLAQRQVMLAQEFEHRLINGLQVISSLLSLQSRAAKTSEAADQLTIAAARVAALGRVHRRLHLLDHQDRVEFKRYLEHLCEDLSRLLCEESGDCAILVEGANAEIPTVIAIPLGFIVNELITNSAKYAKGNITVRFETTAPGCHSLSVSDGGPGLPADFDPRGSKGLGMKIVAAQVKQIGGELRISAGADGRGRALYGRVPDLRRLGLTRPISDGSWQPDGSSRRKRAHCDGKSLQPLCCRKRCTI